MDSPPKSGVSHKLLLRISIGLVAVLLVLLGTWLHPRPNVDFDETLQLPIPPTSAPFYRTNNIICAVFMTACGLLAVALGARDALRSKSLLPLILPISGAFIAFPETFIDVMGGIYYPWSDNYPALRVNGRVLIPWIPVWFGYGALMQTNLQMLMSKASTKTLWYLWGAMMLADMLIEEILLPMGVFVYYGNQPLIVLNMFPWWWMPANSVGVFLATSLAYRFREKLVGWKVLFVLVLTPASVGAVYGFIAMPTWIAINGDLGWFVTQMLGLATCALGFVAFCGILELVLDRSPFEMQTSDESVVTEPTDADLYRD